MRSLGLRLALVALALAGGMVLCSCQDEGPGDPWADADCIGPAGGSVAVTDTSDLLCGVSLDVAPGDWSQCWSVYLWYRSTFTTPNFPDGIEGYEGWLTGGVDLQIGRGVEDRWIVAPEPLEFELTFPLRDLTADQGWKIMAFRYDEAAGVYRLVVPLRVGDGSLTVKARHHTQLWTWGKVDLEEVDFDTYLAPVMAELHGEGGWLEIQAELNRLAEEAVAERRALTCEALRIVGASLLAAGETAADNVRAIQDALQGRCGVCDATTSQFYDELAEYLKLRVGQFVYDFFLGNSGNVLVKIYGLVMSGYMEYLVWQLQCDYECFVDEVDVAFYVQLGIHFTCRVMAGLIDWAIASGYVDCGP